MTADLRRSGREPDTSSRTCTTARSPSRWTRRVASCWASPPTSARRRSWWRTTAAPRCRPRTTAPRRSRAVRSPTPSSSGSIAPKVVASARCRAPLGRWEITRSRPTASGSPWANDCPRAKRSSGPGSRDRTGRPAGGHRAPCEHRVVARRQDAGHHQKLAGGMDRSSLGPANGGGRAAPIDSSSRDVREPLDVVARRQARLLQPAESGAELGRDVRRGGRFEPPQRVVSTAANENGGVLSPDSRWMLYLSDEPGRTAAHAFLSVR